MAAILVIDDDDAFRRMLQQMLEQDGHCVSGAADGAEALRLLAHGTPDLILTDILMPGMDGIELIIELARQGSVTPLIAMSAGRRSITPQFNLESAALMGVRTTLLKPFARAALRDAIAQALG